MNLVTFNQIQTGKQFKISSGIIYQKIDSKTCKPVLDPQGNSIKTGRVSSSFYNSSMLVTPVN